MVSRALRQIFIGAMGDTDRHTRLLEIGADKENSDMNTRGGAESTSRHSPLKLSRQNMCSVPGRVKGRSESSFICKCSFYEIYQERVFDLLSEYSDAGAPSAECFVREDTELGVFVDNCTEIVLDSLAVAEQVSSV